MLTLGLIFMFTAIGLAGLGAIAWIEERINKKCLSGRTDI